MKHLALFLVIATLVPTLSSHAEESLPQTLTPPVPAQPRINGPSVFGVRPGSPVLYFIPASGERPMSYQAEKLPAGLRIDSETGAITGKLLKAGKYPILLHAKNSKGEATRNFKIIVGDRIALTPPMGSARTQGGHILDPLSDLLCQVYRGKQRFRGWEVDQSGVNAHRQILFCRGRCQTVCSRGI